MTFKFSAHFFEGSEEGALALWLRDALRDARISAWRALSHIDVEESDTLSTYDHLVAQGAARSEHPLVVAVNDNVSLSTPVATIFLLGYLYNWSDELISSFSEFETLLRYAWEPEDAPNVHLEASLLNQALAGAGAIATLTEAGEPVPNLLSQAAERFKGLAAELAAAEHLDTALACALSAMNLATGVDAADAEFTCRLAIDIARRLEDESSLPQLNANHAHLLAQIAKEDRSRRVDAFDAFESALWQLPSDRDARKSLSAMLYYWLGTEEYLKPLRSLLYLALPPEERVPMYLDLDGAAVDPSALAVGANPIWAGSLQEWFDRIEWIRAIYIDIEDARLALMPQSTRLNPRAVWNTWSVEHPQLLHAVPHSKSILKERSLDDFLLSLNHEITHIYSMAGSVGLVLLAMRWALLELELDLWGHLEQYLGEEVYDVFKCSPSPAPLQEYYSEIAPAQAEQAEVGERKLVALAQVEQTVEVERKIQVLENIWQPWFEGLAVFGESAADPQMDPTWESPVESVIYNLWDRNSYTEARESNLSLDEVSAQDRTDADALYGKAIQTAGVHRLHTYLVRNPRNYLPGYLAVRSVVSAWRSRVGRPIRGDEAFRVLLHMTRTSGFDLIPDPGLSLEDFGETAVASHMEWLHAIAAASREDLDNILGEKETELGPSTHFHWVEGRLKQTVESDEGEQRFRQNMVALATKSMSSMRGERASVERVSGADALCRTLMEHMAQALDLKRHSEPGLFTPDRVATLAHRLLILPLGQVDCPFWLVEKDRYLMCLIRTREEDSEHGKPSYDLAGIPLDEAKYTSLRRQVLQQGGRRMTVTRIADLLLGLEHRLTGMNLMVFQYGDWMHIQPRGALFGSNNVEPSLHESIEDRLSPSPLLAFQEELTGGEHPAARRTAQWLSANKWSDVEIGPGVTVNLDPWIERVKSITDQILSNDAAEVHAVSRLLLEFVIGDLDNATSIEERGLWSLYEEDADTVWDLIKFFEESGRRPVKDNPDLELLDEAVRAILVTLMERTPMGWDTVGPAMNGEGITSQ